MSQRPAELRDVIITGAAVFQGTVALPSGAVLDTHIGAGAAIATSKMRHRHASIKPQAESDTTVSAHTRVLHAVHGATGQVIRYAAGLVSPNTGDATVSIDLQVNGVSILSATFDLTSSHTARQLVNASIDTAALNVGDVIERVVTVNAGTGALGAGFFDLLLVDEDAA